MIKGKAQLYVEYEIGESAPDQVEVRYGPVAMACGGQRSNIKATSPQDLVEAMDRIVLEFHRSTGELQ